MQKFNEVSLNRTFCPKTVIYRSDGFGRDYYISKNCGGFSIQEGSPIGQKQMLVYNTKCSNSPGKFLVYRANGTGRDSYTTFLKTYLKLIIVLVETVEVLEQNMIKDILPFMITCEIICLSCPGVIGSQRKSEEWL